jgi:hypothetical protein
MKVKYPEAKNFRLVNKPACASCVSIQKESKTKTAFCVYAKITFPLYESTLFYVCDDFEAVAEIKK